MRLVQDPLTVEVGIIVNAVSVDGKLDGGFTKQLVKAYPQVVEPYMRLCNKADQSPIDRLGQLLLVPVTPKLAIANLFCIRGSALERRLDHVAFIICLDKLVEADSTPSLVHFPYKLGAGHLGSEWKTMEQYIHKIIGKRARICIARVQSPGR